MSTIIYEDDADEIRSESVRLNGRDGAIELYENDEASQYGEEFLIFENADTLQAFIERLTDIAEQYL